MFEGHTGSGDCLCFEGDLIFKALLSLESKEMADLDSNWRTSDVFGGSEMAL